MLFAAALSHGGYLYESLTPFKKAGFILSLENAIS